MNQRIVDLCEFTFWLYLLPHAIVAISEYEIVIVITWVNIMYEKIEFNKIVRNTL